MGTDRALMVVGWAPMGTDPTVAGRRERPNRAGEALSGADRGCRMPRRGAKPGRRQVETGGEGCRAGHVARFEAPGAARRCRNRPSGEPTGAARPGLSVGWGGPDRDQRRGERHRGRGPARPTTTGADSTGERRRCGGG